jgi:hypothetical protein
MSSKVLALGNIFSKDDKSSILKVLALGDMADHFHVPLSPDAYL